MSLKQGQLQWYKLIVFTVLYNPNPKLKTYIFWGLNIIKLTMVHKFPPLVHKSLMSLIKESLYKQWSVFYQLYIIDANCTIYITATLNVLLKIILSICFIRLKCFLIAFSTQKEYGIPENLTWNHLLCHTSDNDHKYSHVLKYFSIIHLKTWQCLLKVY